MDTNPQTARPPVQVDLARIDAAERDSAMLGDRSAMIDQISEILSTPYDGKPWQLYSGLSADELLAEPDVLNEHGKVIGRKAAYQLRYSELGGGYNFDIVGKVTTAQFADMVRSAMHGHVVQELTARQAGDWRLVAWRLVVKPMRNRHRRPKARVEEWQPGAEISPGRGPDRPQVTELVYLEGKQMQIQAAFAELTGQEPVDQWMQRTGKPDGGMARYAQTQLLAHQPLWLRETRDQAVKLIKEFDAYRAQQAATAEGAAVVTGRADPSAIGETAAMLHDRGKEWPEIAKLLGVPWQTARGLAEKWRNAHPPDAAPAGDGA